MKPIEVRMTIHPEAARRLCQTIKMRHMAGSSYGILDEIGEKLRGVIEDGDDRDMVIRLKTERGER